MYNKIILLSIGGLISAVSSLTADLNEQQKKLLELHHTDCKELSDNSRKVGSYAACIALQLIKYNHNHINITKIDAHEAAKYLKKYPNLVHENDLIARM